VQDKDIDLTIDKGEASFEERSGQREEADFGRVALRLNIDSPKNAAPMLTPYRPPTSALFFQTSTEWA
jgi:hypothetical protein